MVSELGASGPDGPMEFTVTNPGRPVNREGSPTMSGSPGSWLLSRALTMITPCCRALRKPG